MNSADNGQEHSSWLCKLLFGYGVTVIISTGNDTYMLEYSSYFQPQSRAGFKIRQLMTNRIAAVGHRITPRDLVNCTGTFGSGLVGRGAG
jgi:hypothetical protein